MSSTSLSALIRPFMTRQGLALTFAAAGLLALLAFVGSAAYEPSNKAGQITAAAGALPVKLAAGAGTTRFSPGQTKAIETIIRDYLISNPEIMLDVQRALQAKTAKIEADRLKVAMKTSAKQLFHRPGSAIAGNPKGDVTVVEFFDYNCGYCKRAFADVAKLVATDKNLRIVFKELPILSKGSEEAARIALAARLQGKYWELHQALLKAPGRANKTTALKVAKKLGLDIARLEKDMASPQVDKEIKATRDLAETLGVNGTPHFFVGDRSVPGAPDNLLGVLSGHVGEIRKKGCAIC